MLMTHAAFVEPERQIAIFFDAIANAWLEVNDAAARAASLRQQGWRHGRCAPPLMAVEWQKMLGRSITELRDEMHVAPHGRTLEFLSRAA
jgi:ubiquinone biosynthesis protein Coq4